MAKEIDKIYPEEGPIDLQAQNPNTMAINRVNQSNE
jgi:hypothetical protein